MNVLLAQLAPVPEDVEANLTTAVGLIESHPDVELLVLPEMFLPGYTLPGVERRALSLDDEGILRLQDAAARHRTAVVVGFAEHLPGRPPANSALCLDEHGDVAGVYRKVHLFGAEVEYFTRGDRYLVVELLGRRVGPMICYDVEFPEPARALSVAGAEMLLTVSANMAPYRREHELFARSRAAENRRPHVYVNRVGVESGFTFVGTSCVVDAGGEVEVALADAEELRRAQVRFGAPPPPDYLGERCLDVPAVPAVPVRRSRPH